MRLSISSLLLAAVVSWGVTLSDFTPSGDGSYKISSADDLKKLATFVNDGGSTLGETFKQTATITISSFAPIGTASNPFNGTFIGSSSDYIRIDSWEFSSDEQNAGLFGVLGTSALVKNVTIYSSKFSLSRNKGSLSFGLIAGTNNGTIDNCSIGLNGGTVDISLTTGVNNSFTLYVGGIAGNNKGTINNSSLAKANLKATFNGSGAGLAGGIAGFNAGTISNSTIAQYKTISSEASSYATNGGYSPSTGGIAGHNSGTISDCSLAYGDTVRTSHATTRVGGIVGDNFGVLKDNYVTESGVVGTSSLAGAIAGKHHNSANESYSNNFYRKVSINETKLYNDIGIGGYGDIPRNNGAMPLADISLSGSNVEVLTEKTNGFYLYNSTIILNYTGTVATGYSVKYTVKDIDGNTIPVTYSGTQGTFSMPGKDVTVSATTIKTVIYTVQFNSNNGANQTKTQTFTNSEAKSLTKNSFSPATGYGNFRFWTTNADGSGTTYVDEQVVSSLTNTNGAVINLYAQWTKKLSNSDISIAAIEDMTYTGSALRPAVTVKDGSTDISSYLTFTYSNNINVGTATVTVTPASADYGYEGSKTATFNIVKATPYVRAPVARVLAYSENAQELVKAGSASIGTLVYSLDGTSYSSAIPKATDIGVYTVYYKVEETDNNYASEIGSVQSEIKESANAVAPKAKTLTYNGTEQVLITAGSTEVGTMLYRMCKQGETCTATYSETIPTATNAGTYTISYMVSYSEEEAETFSPVAGYVTSKIQKATPNITAPKIISDKVKYRSNQKLITAGSTDFGTMTYCECYYNTSTTYCKNSSQFSTKIPTSGSYTPQNTIEVYYMVEGDDNHETVKRLIGYVSIVKASVIRTPARKIDRTYNGEKQVIIDEPTLASDYVNELRYYVNDENIGSRLGYNTTQRYCSGSHEYCLNGYPAATDAGTYKVRYVVEVTTNDYYEDGEDSVFVVIEKANPTVTPPTAKTLAYNGENRELVAAGSTRLGTLLYSLDKETFSEAIPTGKNAGTYSVYYKVEETNNWIEVFDSVQTIIQKASPIDRRPLNKTYTYDGNDKELVSAGSSSQGTMVYSLDGVNFSENIPKARDAGTYTIYYKVRLESQYTANYSDGLNTVTSVINKKKPSITVTPRTLTYNGRSLVLVTGPRSFNYDGTNTTPVYYGLDIQNINLDQSPTAANAGTYSVYYRIDETINYESLLDSVHVTINKASATSITPPTANELTYNGEAQELVTAGSTNSDCRLVYSLDATNFSRQVPTVVNAGQYNVSYKLDEENCTGNVTGGTIVVDVDKAKPVITAPRKRLLTFSGTEQELIIAGSANPGMMLYSLDETNFSESIPKAKDAGTYPIFFKVPATQNYYGVRGVVESLIEQAIINVFVEPVRRELHFTGEAQELVTPGSTDNDACPLLYSLDKENFSEDIPTATNVGVYSINYKVDEANCIKPVKGTVESVIYQAKITPPKPKELVYNGKAQELVEPGYPSACFSYSLDKETFSKDIPTATNAGEYPVIYIVTDTKNCIEYDGYAMSYIHQAAPNITLPEPKSLTYNGKAQKLVTAGSANSGPMLYSLDGKNYSKNIPTGVDVGDYTIYVRVEAAQNYDEYNGSISVAIKEAWDYKIYPIEANELVYNGKEQKLITEEKPNFCLEYTIKTGNSDPVFSKELPVATDAGDYIVLYRLDRKNCRGDEFMDGLTVTIKMAPVTTPQAKLLTYNGEPQELITEGSPSVCLAYSLDGNNYSADIPTAVESGLYRVYYIVDQKNCNGNNGWIESIIDKKPPSVTITAPIARKIIKYTGKMEELLEKPGRTTSGQMLYSLDNINYSEEPPRAVDQGFYTIYYRVDDGKYILGEGTVSAIIAEDPVNYAFIDVFRVDKKIYATIDGNYTEKVPFALKTTDVDTVIFERNFPITEGTNYSTFMLPFDIEIERLNGAAESNVFAFNGVNRNKETGALQVEIARTKIVKAYKPYIVQMSSPTLQIKGAVTLQSMVDKPITEINDWTMIGTIEYTKWEKGHEDLGRIYGFSTTPLETSSGKKYDVGQFFKVAAGSFIKPMRAYLYYRGKPMYAPSANGSASPTASIVEGLPDMMDVVIVERDDEEEEHTTVIGKFNTRTGEFRLNRGTRTFDLKGRNVGKQKAKGVYLKK